MERNFASPLGADYENILGPIEHYNGILFGDMTATQADCEGALAVGGSAKLGSPGYGYDVGGADADGFNHDYVYMGTYENPNGYPSMLLGGTVSSESLSTRIHNGPLVMRSSYQTAYEGNSFQFEAGTVRYEDDTLVDAFFADALSETDRILRVLAKGAGQTIALGHLPTLNTVDHSQYKVEGLLANKKVLIYSIACNAEDSINIGEIDFDDFINDYDLIVFYAPAKKVSYSNGALLFEGTIIDTSLPRAYEGNKMIQRLASKLLFAFPNAEEVSLAKYGIIGSVLAPKARITGNGGSINGMLIAEGLYQDGGMELHAFGLAMGKTIWDLKGEEPLGSVTLQKLDKDSREKLFGASFALYQYNEETRDYDIVVGSGKTDSSGLLTFEDLPAGQYKLVETDPPAGYPMPAEPELTFALLVNEEGEIIDLDIIYIENELAKVVGRAAFVKLDSDDNEIALVGAIFSVYQYNEESKKYDILVEAGLETDSEGHLDVDDLEPGKYRLVETQAPLGYHLPTDFWIDFEVEVDDKGEVIEFELMEVTNQQLLTIEIVKVDDDDDSLTLEGAVFDLYLLNEETDTYEKIASDITSGTDGVITLRGYGPGHYKLEETQAPTGYYLDLTDNETEFTIEENDQGRLIVMAPTEIGNKKLGAVEIIKVDAANRDTVLENATFDLYKLNTETDTYELLRSGLTTDSAGSLVIEDLAPGDYKLVETASPEGYVLPTDPETFFTITL